MKQRVKCKICGKVGDLTLLVGLLKHLRLAHKVQLPNKNLSLENFHDFIEEYYEETDSSAPIEIGPKTTKGAWKTKNKNYKSKNQIDEIKLPRARIIYTPMGNKR